MSSWWVLGRERERSGRVEGIRREIERCGVMGKVSKRWVSERLGVMSKERLKRERIGGNYGLRRMGVRVEKDTDIWAFMGSGRRKVTEKKERGRDIERWMMGLLWVGVVRGLEYRNI